MPYKSYTIPVSVKGVVFDNEKVWLRKNQRNEWELPGGKLDRGEQPEGTVVRELWEELGFKLEVVDLVQAHLYVIEKATDEKNGVLVISYLCKLLRKGGTFERNGEAGSSRFQAFPIGELASLNMPQFYKDAIARAARH